jgi:drug/metabolite transporter (DMT)-like permease
LAYLGLAIIMPAVILGTQGDLAQGWKFRGVSWSLIAGCAGAFGALGIIIAMTSGGKPIYVMPLVFGCAPVVNVFLSMFMSETERPTPMFYSGIILVSLGAAMVFIFQPKSLKPHGPPPAQASSPASPAETSTATP